MDMFPLKVFYNPDPISNMLALVDFTSQALFDVTSHIATMDTNNEPAMFAHTGPDFILNFY